jgi:predicted nucleotidyltransferase
MTLIPRDFQDFLRLLNDQGIEYLIVGGYAVGHYGYVRYTGDLDVFVGLSKKNAERLTRAFRDFGFDVPEVKPELFLNKGRVVRIGNEPMRLEILNEIDGVEFEDCYANRNEVDLGGVKANVISLTHLLQNKKASGRSKDLADVEALSKGKK